MIPVTYSGGRDHSTSSNSVQKGCKRCKAPIHRPRRFAHLAHTALEVTLYYVWSAARLQGEEFFRRR